MYDGHNHVPKGDGLLVWLMLQIERPWHRMPEGFNPLKVVDVFMENAIVSQLKDGRYIMYLILLGTRKLVTVFLMTV
jgi:hypothetical protein